MLTPIPPSAFTLTASPPSFTQLTADTLGNAATETDGFDVALQDIALALASESDSLPGLDSDLAEAAFTFGEFEAGSLAPITAEVAASVTGGDAVIGDLEKTVGDPSLSFGDVGPGGGVAPPQAMLTANGVHGLTVAVGDTITYAWSSANAASAGSTFAVDGVPAGLWLADSVVGGRVDTVVEIQRGHTYTITYTVTGADGTTRSDHVTIVVTA